MSIYKSGTIINNRYEVVQGPKEKPSLAGGMGLVYLCVDHAEDGKPVALKTFRPELLSDRAARDRFLREGTTWVELGYHPHIVRCYEVFKVSIGTDVFFSLELVAPAEGKGDASLRSWLIPDRPLPIVQALLFGIHIVRGMIHATNTISGLVHRDLKPENILIGRDERARVTDFGLASVAQNLGSDWQTDSDKSSSHIRTQLTHGIAGTPLYMAPEQWKGEPLDERADIYAFGCILYEMLCGNFAFTGNSIEELKKAHCKGRLREIPMELNESLGSLLRRCLALDRIDRYNSWEELERKVAEVYHTISGDKVSETKQEVKNTQAERIASGNSYNSMGLSYQNIGKFEVGICYFKQALTVARQERDLSLEGAVLGNLGNTYLYLGDFRRALEFHEQRLIITKKIRDRHGEGQTLGNLGSAYFQLGDIRRAIEFYEQWLAIAQESDNRHEEGSAMGNLGNAYFQLGDVRRAIEFFEQHLAIAREINDRHGEELALGSLGIAYRKLGDCYQAIDFHKQQLAIAREIGDRHGEGSTLGNLGNTYSVLGDLNQAIEFYEQWIAIAQEIGDRHGEGSALDNLGVAYYQLGDVQQAVEFHKKSLAISNETGNRYLAGNALGNLGNAYLRLGESHQAIQFYEQRLAIAKEIGDRHGEGQALGNLGSAYLQLGDSHRAIEFYERHLAFSREIGDIISAAGTSLNMALLLQQVRPHDALCYAEYALTVFTKVGHRKYVSQTQQLLTRIQASL